MIPTPTEVSHQDEYATKPINKDFFSKKNVAVSKHHIKEALQFNKAIFAENVIIPNKLNNIN